MHAEFRCVTANQAHHFIKQIHVFVDMSVVGHYIVDDQVGRQHLSNFIKHEVAVYIFKGLVRQFLTSGG